MQGIYAELIAVIIGYLLGSIPFGLISSKLIDGVDPRLKGSGNIGFTNVLRVGSKISAFVTLIGDIGKGTVAILISTGMGISEEWMLAVGLSAVLGHIYPLFLRFRGGKGVATSLGVLFALQPLLAVITLFIWITVSLVWRYASLGSILAFLFLPIDIIILKKGTNYLLFSILLLIILISRHHQNIARLISGKENTIWKRP